MVFQWKTAAAATSRSRYEESQKVVISTKIKWNKNDNTKLTPLPDDPRELCYMHILLACFVCALLIVCAHEFPAKFESQNPGEIIVYCTLYARTRLPRTTWTHCIIPLEVGLPDVLDLDNISYYFSIKDFMNSWMMNYYSPCTVSFTYYGMIAGQGPTPLRPSLFSSWWLWGRRYSIQYYFTFTRHMIPGQGQVTQYTRGIWDGTVGPPHPTYILGCALPWWTA